MKHFTKFIPVAALLCLGHVHAADMNMQNMDMKDMQGMHMQHKNGPAKAVGIVKQIDRGNEVVTIHHEPIKSLGWSSMTMDFVARDKTLLNKLSVGEKVDFEFVTENDQYILTAIKQAK